MIVGNRNIGATVVGLAAETKRLAVFEIPGKGLIGKLSVYLDGLGPGSGTALVTGLVYDTAGVFVGRTDEVAIPGGQPAAWVDFHFTDIPGGCPVGPGHFSLGLHLGGGSNIVRVHTTPSSLGGITNADVYGDGPTVAIGTGTALTTDLSLYAIATSAFVPPPSALEMYYGRLPWFSAEAKFGETAPVKGTATTAMLSWHGTNLDLERGAFAVVKTGGIFDDWIGERVKITTRPIETKVRSLVAYVHNYAALDDRDDISITRRGWMQIALAGNDRLRVRVERLS
jgi:hypothetical protein